MPLLKITNGIKLLTLVYEYKFLDQYRKIRNVPPSIQGLRLRISGYFFDDS